MDGFCFTETHEIYRREIRNFVQKEMLPDAKHRAKKEGLNTELVKKIGDMGLLGANLPEEFGGQPSDWVSVGIGMEECGRSSPVEGMLLLLPHVFYGSMKNNPRELIAQFLTPLIYGDRLGCFCVTEPDCGSDAGAMKSSAIKAGDHYVFNGEKTSVTFGLQADTALMFVKTDPTAGPRGVSCFLVPLDLPGITRSRFGDMGMHGAGRASIIMDDVKVPANYLLGDEGRGFHQVMETFDWMRVGVALSVLGSAGISLEEAIEYAKQRTAFGKPIGKFEGVAFKLAEAATLLEAARMLCYRTLSMRDSGLNHTKETAMCKWWCPQVAVQIIHDCLLIFGHIGYSEEYPLEQRLRDVIGLELGDGTAEVQKMIITREMLGKEFLPY